MIKTYRGSCHCQAVQFEADIDLAQPTFRCNCSICRRTRFWPAIVKPEHFRLLAGHEALTQYLFNTRKNEHYFCRHCGVRPFGHGTQTPLGELYGVNLGCLDGVSEAELEALIVVRVDGQHDNWGQPPAHGGYL